MPDSNVYIQQKNLSLSSFLICSCFSHETFVVLGYLYSNHQCILFERVFFIIWSQCKHLT